MVIQYYQVFWENNEKNGEKVCPKGIKETSEETALPSFYHGLSKAPDGWNLLQNCFSVQIHKYAINIQ